MLEARAASMRRCWWPYLRQKKHRVFLHFLRILWSFCHWKHLKTTESIWLVETWRKGTNPCITSGSKYSGGLTFAVLGIARSCVSGTLRLLILQGVQVFHVIQFYILNNAKVDTKRMNNWMVQKQLPYQLVITLDCFLCSQASRAAQDSWWFMMNHPEIGVRSL